MTTRVIFEFNIVKLILFNNSTLHRKHVKYYIIAGEASGDLHGANLINELKLIDKHANFRCWGGDLMQTAGATLVKHHKDLAFMGLYEVVKNILTIQKNFKFCEKDIADFQPDVLILIDYPGFNLRMAKFAHNLKIKVFYYISPKIWAWNEKRINPIKKYVDKMFVIFPFEVDYYKQNFDYQVYYAGNPILDALEQKKQIPDFNKFISVNQLENKQIVALLAGSRKQEIERLLPEMLAVIPHFPYFQFVIAGVSSLEPELYRKICGNSNVKIIFDKTYSLLQHAEAAVVTSGTATLETALLNVPEVVVYKTSPITFHIGKLFVDIKYFSLVNIIMDSEVVKELLQFDLQQDIKTELQKILHDNSYKNKMLDNYQLLHQKLGESGASKRVAEMMYKFLS